MNKKMDSKGTRCRTDMGNVAKKRRQEKEMLETMISLYCHGSQHKGDGELCPDCAALLEYALKRTQKCPFMETKTFCSACSVHCYSNEMQEKIRAVMRYAGPRMLFVHPIVAIRHVKVTIQQKRRDAKAGSRISEGVNR